jgi:hypothetical protein
VDNVVRTLLASLDGLPGSTYDLVERNLSILEIAHQVQGLYPDLELLFIQQDVPLRDLRVRPDPRLEGVLERRSFESQLRALRDRFSF